MIEPKHDFLSVFSAYVLKTTAFGKGIVESGPWYSRLNHAPKNNNDIQNTGWQDKALV
jgi:hypothetical protein